MAQAVRQDIHSVTDLLALSKVASDVRQSHQADRRRVRWEPGRDICPPSRRFGRRFRADRQRPGWRAVRCGASRRPGQCARRRSQRCHAASQCLDAAGRRRRGATHPDLRIAVPGGRGAGREQLTRVSWPANAGHPGDTSPDFTGRSIFRSSTSRPDQAGWPALRRTMTTGQGGET